MASPPSPPPMIGSATMLPDGTLVLNLRAVADDGTIGHAQFRYPMDHPQYTEILLHVSPIAPGDNVPVKPFPPGVPKPLKQGKK